MNVVKKDQYVAGDKIKFIDQFPLKGNFDEGGMMMEWQGKTATVKMGTSELPKEYGTGLTDGLYIEEDAGEKDDAFMKFLLTMSGCPENIVELSQHWFWENSLIEGVVTE